MFDIPTSTTQRKLRLFVVLKYVLLPFSFFSVVLRCLRLSCSFLGGLRTETRATQSTPRAYILLVCRSPGRWRFAPPCESPSSFRPNFFLTYRARHLWARVTGPIFIRSPVLRCHPAPLTIKISYEASLPSPFATPQLPRVSSCPNVLVYYTSTLGTLRWEETRTRVL